MKRQLHNAGKRVLRQVLEIGQKCGVSILPHHYYGEVPSFERLRRESQWRRPRSMKGVQGIEISTQVEFLTTCFSSDITSYLASHDVHMEAVDAHGENGFGRVEADVLFAFVASHRPPKIVQVGCGVSTAVTLHASRYAGYEPTVLCVEPYPSQYLRRLDEEGAIDLRACGAEDLDALELADVGTDGFLFVDSTHAVRPGGEVNRIVFDVIPELPDGAFAHFHDVTFPYDYPRGLLSKELFFSHESVLLYALLVHNSRLRVEASLSMLHYQARQELAALLPHYEPAHDEDGIELESGHFPSSLYLRVKDHIVGGVTYHE